MPLELYLDMVEQATLLGGGECFKLFFAAAKVEEIVPVFDMAFDQVLKQAVSLASTSDA